MRPAIVMSMNDPKGLLFPQLEAITPQLKELFEAAFVSVPLATSDTQAHHHEWLAADSFFQVCAHVKAATTFREDFVTLYEHAATTCPSSQILHLCFIDRVAYALLSRYQEFFWRDIQELTGEKTPLIFQRSSAAWETHPQNYRELEQMVTRVGELLFGKSLDFAWCHLAIQAGQLEALLPKIRASDISLVAEMVLHLRDSVHTKEVDWLAWEDPFIEKSDPLLLKQAREASLAENCKRLSYVVPMLQLLRETVCP